MKKSAINYLIILIYLLFSINTSCKEIYKNNEIGFSFIIPDKVIFDKERKYHVSAENTDEMNKVIDNKYYVHIDIDTIEGFYKKNPEYLKGLEKNEKILLDRLNKGKSLFSIPNNNYEIIDIFEYKGKNIGQRIRGFGDPQFANPTYVNSIIFIKENYMIEITIEYCDPFYRIPPKYSKYFYYNKLNKDWEFIRGNTFVDFDDDILQRSPKAPSELIKIVDYYNVIEKSITLFDDTKKSFFTPTIPNLLFRQTPTQNGKVIRKLTPDDKLEILEKGKEETINGVKGNWVKVKTQKGETGWCFDAFLKEIKEGN